ncbi:YonK family protein [Lysinibacillus sp. BPa_S21]|uniref:YonK family protein n=1 Tax=Lysinibacillus sp. BPa_S21 TaxID=2932478 RepID=UPI0020124F78|nr:YonK family protein [Lysinibacillus sp. BPa_S21]MCL1696274.1 YonK family protein [Lysinibacillus sp. BPa_S21]
MAKENKGFGFNGKLKFEDGKYYITETVKGVESTYDFSAKLDEFLGNHVSVSGKLETSIDPIED